MVSSENNCEELLQLLSSKLGAQLTDAKISLGHVVIRLPREQPLDFFKILKLDRDLAFNMLIDVTVVDWLDQHENRFEVVYHLLSFPKGYRLRVKVELPESKPEIDSIVSLWSGANFMEREAFDMYGVIFKGHPNLRRILMYDEFKGYPLRKDYPVQAKQPRIPLRSPEVRNTAVDMQRPELVKINTRSKSAGLASEEVASR